MNNFGRFSQAKICFFIHKGGVFALHQSLKVLVKLFQKLAGLGRAHKNGAFFLPSFFFAPLVPKKKRDWEILCFLGGEENFLKKAFLPRTPSFKNFKTGVLFFCRNVYARPFNAQCSHHTYSVGTGVLDCPKII